MSPANDFPDYNTIPGAGRLVGEPPFTFNGVVLRIFPIHASGQKLQRFVGDCLNIVPDEIAYYRLALPYVYILMVSYEEMSPQAIEGNWVSQCEITFSIALERYRKVRGRFAFQDWTWFSPYILVDEELSQMTGREVYGWPKELGRLGQREAYWERHPRNPRSLFRFSARAVTFGAGRPQFRPSPLIDVDQLAPTSYLQVRPREQEMLQVPLRAARSAAGALARSADLSAFLAETWGAGAIGMELDGAIPSSFPPALLFRELLRRPTNGTTTLKQFRDEVYPKEICYQAIVSAPLELKRFRNVGLLGEANVLWGDSSGGYMVRLFDDVTHPIAKNLGLISGEDTGPRRDPGGRRYVDLTPVLPFWVEADLTYGKGTVIAWRDQRNEWRTERGGRTWVFRNRKESAAPLFNDSLGGAPERFLSPLKPTPADNDMQRERTWEQKPFTSRRDQPRNSKDQEGSAKPKGLGRPRPDEVPDLRMQRVTYLVFGFKAEVGALDDTCHQYLCKSSSKHPAGEKCEYVPVRVGADGAKADQTETGAGGCVYLLFGVIEQFGGRPTVGGESWRVFDVQLGFPVRRAFPEVGADPDQTKQEAEVLFTVPYQFTDQTLAGIVNREFYGWPAIASHIQVSDTAWLDPSVSGYSVRFKAEQGANSFFDVVVDGPEGQTTKVVEMLLQPSSPSSKPFQIARKASLPLEDLIRLVRRGYEKPKESGFAPAQAWSGKQFERVVGQLVRSFLPEHEPTPEALVDPKSISSAPSGPDPISSIPPSPGSTSSAPADPKSTSPAPAGPEPNPLAAIPASTQEILDQLKTRSEDLEARFNEAIERVPAEQRLETLQRVEDELWNRHPAVKLAATFMNDGAGEKTKPALIQRIGLKQFRAADEPTKACYQSLVKTPIEIDDWSENSKEFRGRPFFQWLELGGNCQAVVRFHRAGWGADLVAALGLNKNPNKEKEDLGYVDPEQVFPPFFMSGQLKIYRSHRLRWRAGRQWHEGEKDR